MNEKCPSPQVLGERMILVGLLIMTIGLLIWILIYSAREIKKTRNSPMKEQSKPELDFEF